MKKELIHELRQLLDLLEKADPQEASDLLAGVEELTAELLILQEDDAAITKDPGLHTGASASEEGPDFSPSLTADPKLAIIVGHTKKDQGACGVAPIDACEYTWNSAVAARMMELAADMRIACAVFFRDNGTDKAYASADQWGAQAIIELHYNASSPTGTGTETLWGRQVSIPWAQAAQNEMVKLLGLKNRGLKDRSKSGRGHYNLTLSKNPSILVEPFFGSSEQDATIAQQNKLLLARAYLQAFKAFIGAQANAEADAAIKTVSGGAQEAASGVQDIPAATFSVPEALEDPDIPPPQPTGMLAEDTVWQQTAATTTAAETIITTESDDPVPTVDITVQPLPGWTISQKKIDGVWNFYLTHDKQPIPLHLGKTFTWEKYTIPTTGLARTTGMQPKLAYDPAETNAELHHWPELIYPTCYAESTANHGVINAWDNAAITLTFLQLAAHVAEDLTPCLKRLLTNLPVESAQWFPELKLISGKLHYSHKGRVVLLEGNHRPADGAATSSWNQGRVMQFFNPSRLKVDPEELHASARWLEWTRTSPAMRKEQTSAAIDNARLSLDRLHKGLLQHATKEYPKGVDGMRCDHLGAALAEPHYNDKVTNSIWALKQPDVLNAFTKIRYAGASGDREKNVVDGVRKREKELFALRYDLKLGHPVKK